MHRATGLRALYLAPHVIRLAAPPLTLPVPLTLTLPLTLPLTLTLTYLAPHAISRVEPLAAAEEGGEYGTAGLVDALAAHATSPPFRHR